MAGESPRVAELEAFIAERGERLLRSSIALAGSREAGEDLLQSALERLFRHWREMQGDPEGYLRRTLVHLATDRWRRNARWRVKAGLLHATTPEFLPDGSTGVDHRDEVVRLLRQLPVRQRTALVLRYWDGLSEAEIAGVMGCTAGAVKSATSRGLQRLRELSGDPQHAGQGGHQ